MELNKSLAEHVTTAEREHNEVAARREAALDSALELQKRIDDLESEREGIIAKRAKDSIALPDDTVGHRLALINADLEGLRPLLAKAEDEAESLDTTPSLQRLVAAQQSWAHHQAEVQFEGLHACAKSIEASFLNVIVAINDTGKKLGRQHLSMNWRPSLDILRLVQYGALPGKQA